MTQEEKLEEAKRLYKDANADQRYVLERLFPEINESERIRQEVINYIKTKKPYWKDFADYSSWIAWLERQDEKDKLNTMLDDSLSRETKETWNKFLNERKPAWSEEDREMRMRVLNYLSSRCSVFDYEEVEHWLNSLKERVQPQPKQEWCEEDGRRINHIITFMSDKERIKDTETMFPIEEDIRWLKSLKERYTWKPSDEQMDALDYYANSLCTYCDRQDDLRSLFNDLKKLKGE